jgi:DNA mismatch endonuclease, patch repair protein
MADVFSVKLRSEIMSRIRSKGNRATEERLRSIMIRCGISGWRRNQAVFGKPDFVFRKLRVAIFVDGCFWHGCPRHGSRPQSNQHFWKEKLNRNKARDLLVAKSLKVSGWRVLRIWQHDLVAKHEKRVIARIRRALRAID